MSTNAAPAPAPFELRVNFTGLALYLVKGDATRMTVVHPDARQQPDAAGAAGAAGMQHLDGEPAAAHVGYLLFDVAQLHVGNSGRGDANAPASFSAQVVHRFVREELRIGTIDDGTPIEGDFVLPDFGVFAPVLEPSPSVLASPPGPEVVMRCSIAGGSLAQADDALDRQMTRTLPSSTSSGIRQSGVFAHTVVWSRPMTGTGVVLTLSRFDGSGSESIPLRPVPDGNGDPVIELTIANLCSDNPLEWNDYPVPPQPAPDPDFKWLAKLFHNKSGEAPPVYNAARQVPHPVRVPGGSLQGAIANCFGARFSIS